MEITFYGAAREVTGSMHLLDSGRDKILLDCGLFQGKRREAAEKNRTTPFDPAAITNIVLSHAHIDHSGRIPLMVRHNFAGRILSTRATCDVAEYMLMDSAHIQQSESEYLNYKAVRRALHHYAQNGRTGMAGGLNPKDARKMLKSGKNRLDDEKINSLARELSVPLNQPLYTPGDAADALACFEGIPYRHPITIGHDLTVTFYEAGHILGSAVSIIKYRDGNDARTICYTGDLGRFGKDIIRDPNLNFPPEDRDIDLMLIESTYGNRTHGPITDLEGKLRDVLTRTIERGGTVVIPSFAYGRTQELLYTIHKLYNKKAVPRVPVHVDSPLASKLTRVFSEHPEVYDGEAHVDFLEKGINPFAFDNLHFTESVDDSMELMRDPTPHIVISASGMCEFGRILHHLRHKIHNPANTILVVGYMAENTLGRRILEEGRQYQNSGEKGSPPLMKILGKEYPLKARVEKIDGFSAHADKEELLRFVKESNLRIKKAAVVHGEADQARPFSRALEAEGIETVIPQPGQTLGV
ncbi:MAG: MBL fold metallo-hydrolase [Desulfosudaceae bacterium]